MRLGLLLLMLCYTLSQFYRGFLPVLAGVLAEDIGASPQDLAHASGLWFLTFAAAQLPIGWALDRFGAKWTTAALLGGGAGGGAVIFATAQGPAALNVAMVLIGAGCAPILMAAYYLIARSYPPQMFGTLAGLILGMGSLGNLAGSVPLAWAIGWIGWRASLLVLAAAAVICAAALALFLRDIVKDPTNPPQGRMRDLWAIPHFWRIAVMMACVFGPVAAIRGLWLGPFVADVYGADAQGIGRVGLAMGAAMICGNFLYGPIDRWVGSRKWPILGGSLGAMACLLALWAAPGAGLWQVGGLLTAVGFLGACYPAIMAHGRAFLPAHLTGRGVTMINLFAIGGAGVVQLASGPLYLAMSQRAASVSAGYGGLFGAFAVLGLLGCAVYAFARDARS